MLTLHFLVASLFLAEIRHFTRTLFTLDNSEQVAGRRGSIQTQNFHGYAGARLIDCLTILIQHGAHAAELQTGKNYIALAQGAALDQQGGDRTAPPVQTGLDNNTLCRHIAGGGQFQHFRLQQNRVKQFINAFTGVGRDVDKLRIATPLLGNDIFGGKLTLDPLRIYALACRFYLPPQ